MVGGTLGAAAIWQRRHRRVQLALPAGPDPAEELRAKLAASKAAALEEPAREPVEPIERIAQPEESPLDPETRRRAVHEQTRASMDQLTSD